MAVVLAAAGAFVYGRVAGHLAGALDQELRSRAQDLSALVLRAGTVEATGGPLIEHGESFAQLVAADGRVLDATRPLGRTRLLTDRELARARRVPTFVNRDAVLGLDEPARMLAMPVERDPRHRVLVVGTTRENRAETLNSLLVAFLIGGPIALVLASLGGYVLAGAALRPIEAMRRRAAEISTSSLDERLPVPPARDEVARLGVTLNAMLSRIEDGLARERRFVADASHELRTPLALLKTELELAVRQSRSPEELERAIRSAADETDRLARLADDLLLLARSERGLPSLHLEPLDVTDVLGTVAQRLSRRAQAEARALAIDAPPGLQLVADRLRLEQALVNMVDNALRYGSGRVALSADAADGSVELHVADEGPGFPPAFLGRAFERFSRAGAERGSPGSGLGLAIVATIARAHAGEAHAANRDGRGADVWIALPRDGA
jgi:signal transduction histidine kinase